MQRKILAFILIGAFILISCGEDDLIEPCDAYITGSVYYPDSTIIPFATVKLIQNDITTTTNQYGRYSFERPDIDTCTIVASYGGYNYSSILVDPQTIGCSRVDFYLEELPHCAYRHELPPDYPLGVYFKNPGFMGIKTETSIGDSLWIKAYEWFQPPPSLDNYESSDVIHDVWIISSLGDSEIRDVDEYPGGIPEIWSFGYIIDTQASFIPYPDNGVLEVEPSGGLVYVFYESHWLKVYVCCSHIMVIAD